jgi:hypothetical protein
MEQYISQLLEDIEQAAAHKLECPDYTLLYPDHPAIAYGLDYIVAWECAPDIPMAEAFGIPAEAFPPPEQLTEEQAGKLNEAILKLWTVNNMYANLPEKLPSQVILYRSLRKQWQEGTVRLLPEGNTGIGFCSYVVGECPWGIDFCTCKDEDWYNEDIDMDDFKNDNKLPS